MAKASFSLPTSLSPKMIVALVVIVILLVAVAPGYYFYMQYQKTQVLLENPSDSAKEQVAKVVAVVSKLIVLPADEDPTLATVSDSTKLQNQAFFANAQNGDKLLIYPRAKKAYLYRPSLNKLIDVAPVNIGSSAPPPVNLATTTTPVVSGKPSGTPKPSVSPTGKPTPTLTPTPTSAFKPVNVALYNGTKTVGLAASVQTKLKTSAPNVTVVAKANATDTYAESLVIDFTGKFAKEAAQLAKLTNGSVGVLPKLETKPTADILIILGPQQ